MSVGNVGSAQSTAALVVGVRVRAMVAEIGNKLELKYIDASRARAGDARTAVDSEPAAEVEARYRLTSDTQARQQLEHAVAQAADAAAMARSGLFLAKMDLPMNAAALQALYEAQRGSVFDVETTSHSASSAEAQAPAIQAAMSRQGSESGAAPEIASLVASVIRGEQMSATELGALLLEALATPDIRASMPATGGDSGANGGDANGGTQRELARSLLNTQDDGSIAYRYGTLPVLIAGQLVELDLVSFQQRRPARVTPLAGRAERASATFGQRISPDRVGDSSRRLIMTLNTQSFGRVQIEARALGERLTITFTGQSVRATQELARYADEIRELGSRFGWDVEAVRYGSDAQQGGAARHIVDHVLAAGSVDQVL